MQIKATGVRQAACREGKPVVIYFFNVIFMNNIKLINRCDDKFKIIFDYKITRFDEIPRFEKIPRFDRIPRFC